MKKTLLLTFALGTSMLGFAQSSVQIAPGSTKLNANKQITDREASMDAFYSANNLAAKGTGITDTFAHLTNAQLDTVVNHGVYYNLGNTAPLDSGLIFGMNPFNFNGFADFYKGKYNTDTTVRILGLVTRFAGTVQPGSNNKINLRIWEADTTRVAHGTKTFIVDLPKTSSVLGSIANIPVTSLGIGPNADSGKVFYFNPIITGVNKNFCAGYDMTYTWGATNNDTVGVYSTRIGSGWGCGYYVLSGTDTILLSQTTVKTAAGWNDITFDYGQDDVNICIIPLIQFQSTVSVQGITKKNLTFFGSYPNPATNSTNVKFALAKSANVSIDIMDVSGRVISTLQQSNMAVGEHVVPVETSSLAAGQYLYSVRTSDGEAFASQLTIVK